MFTVVEAVMRYAQVEVSTVREPVSRMLTATCDFLDLEEFKKW